jgi:ATP-dependent 26S proteasome regulatory subunit
MVPIQIPNQVLPLFAFEFSLLTLTTTLTLPFLYYTYQTKLWSTPKFWKRGDFTLRILTFLLMALLLVKTASLDIPDLKTAHLPLLHFVGPLLTLLAIRKTRFDRWLNQRFQGVPTRIPTQETQSTQQEEENSFTPLFLSHKSQKVHWDDIIINDSLKKQLLSIVELLRSPEKAKKYGIETPKGIIFHGPPGTGKTTIARAFASTAGLNFFSVAADDIISKFVGESEKNLSRLFHAAEQHRPAVVFIDEIDSIGRARGGKSQAWAENLLNHFLQIIDGIKNIEGVYIIGATNRVDLVDDALKRAGRLSKSIEISPPDHKARTELFSIFLRNITMDKEIDISYLAEITEGCTGADIKEICNQAGLNAFNRESQKGNHRHYRVSEHDLFHAIEQYLQPADKTQYC